MLFRSDKDKDGESSVATSLEGTPAAEDQPSSSHLTSIHDAEGEGEEDEETAHEVRSKVYKMTKKSDGSQEWIDMGVGVQEKKNFHALKRVFLIEYQRLSLSTNRVPSC